MFIPNYRSELRFNLHYNNEPRRGTTRRSYLRRWDYLGEGHVHRCCKSFVFNVSENIHALALGKKVYCKVLYT